jgi:hypothetical protein
MTSIARTIGRDTTLKEDEMTFWEQIALRAVPAISFFGTLLLMYGVYVLYQRIRDLFFDHRRPSNPTRPSCDTRETLLAEQRARGAKEAKKS